MLGPIVLVRAKNMLKMMKVKKVSKKRVNLSQQFEGQRFDENLAVIQMKKHDERGLP